MVASTDVLDALKSIGLNLYERKIFVALLAKGVATAAEVSEIANVPRSRSYDVLQSLADKGFVLVQPSKPIKYVALAPKDAFERTRQVLAKKHDEMVDRISRLSKSPIMSDLEGLHKKGIDIMQPSEMTGTLKGKHIINRQMRSALKEARKGISILTTENGVNDLYSSHFRVLKKLSKGGVKVKIAAPLSNNSAVKALSDVAELRALRNPLGRVCIVDDSNVMLSLTDDTKTHETQDVAFWASSEYIARRTIQPYFDYIWNSSKPFRK
jgi:sugar-specific transcriptional regulator TrmB